jgi:hypothetical protein
MAILFEKDWRNAAGKLRAIPHYNTKNVSFLRMAQLLKKMGIKNYAFHLCLYDKDLLNVDPHSLTEDTPENEILRQKVCNEAARNLWYFKREVLKIYSQGGDPVPYELNRGSLSMTWCFLNGIDYWSMQPRQAQPLDAKIRTPDGHITMGDVAYGTQILAPDGTTVRVAGVYPHGAKPVYKVTLSDGRSTECCNDHLWRVYCSSWKEPWRVYSLEQIRASQDEILIPFWNGTDFSNHLTIDSIEYVGDKEVQCIHVDHPDHLYITDDDIVTHNTGKTVGALAITTWVMYIGAKSYTFGMMTKDDTLRTENISRIKRMRETLPSWMLAPDRYADKNNSTTLYYAALKNKYETMVGQADEASADKQARGSSPSGVHFDEIAFISHIRKSYSVILSSTDTARANAKANGQPHSNIITTTAGDPSKRDAKAAAEILDGAMNFTETLYDIEDSEKLHMVVKANSPKKMINGTFSHLQLGRTNEWLRDIITRNNLSADEVCRDYLNRWVSVQDNPIIPKEILSRITSSQIDPVWTEIISDRFLIRWYVPQSVVESRDFKNTPIIVGCDSSELINRDATTLVGINPKTLEVVFTYRAVEGNINTVATSIANFLIRYPKMLFIPENKSSGTSIIDIVGAMLTHAGQNPFKRIFNWVVDRRNEAEFGRININDPSLLETSVKRYFGIKTDKSKRDELYSSVLIKATSRAGHLTKDARLVSELSSLVERNGRVDHAADGKDDTVIAYLMAMWIIFFGKNLDVYGIEPGTIMSFASYGNSNSEEEQKRRKQEAIIKHATDQIEKLSNALKNQFDLSVIEMIKGEIRKYEAMLPESRFIEPATTDEIMRDPFKFADRKAVEDNRGMFGTMGQKRAESILTDLLG